MHFQLVHIFNIYIRLAALIERFLYTKLQQYKPVKHSHMNWNCPNGNKWFVKMCSSQLHEFFSFSPLSFNIQLKILTSKQIAQELVHKLLGTLKR